MSTVIRTRLDVGQQADFFMSTARYPALFGGRGSGKTKTLVLRMMTYAVANPGSRNILTEPTYRMIEDNLLPVIDREYGFSRGKRWDLQVSDMVIDLDNSSQILLRAAEVPERFRGLELASWGMDEAAIGHQEAAYLLLVPTLRQPGYEHHGWIATTPRGRNWLWRDWVNPETRKPGHEAYHSSTRDNRYLPDEEVSAWEQAYGDTQLAAQELEGKFIELAGQVFPQFARALHVQGLHDGQWATMRQRLGGIDFGGSAPTALVVGGLSGDGRAYAVAEWYRHQSTLDELVGAMSELGHKWGVTQWICDPSGAQQMEFLRRQGLGVYPASHGNKIDLRVQLYGARLNKTPSGVGCLISPACPNLISETESLTWERVILPGRGMEIMADRFERGAPDHAVDAWTNVLSAFDKPATWELPRYQLRMR